MPAKQIAKARRELQAASRFDFARTPHFNVRYDGLIDTTLASAVMEYLEDEILDGALLTHNGEVRHGPTAEAL